MENLINDFTDIVNKLDGTESDIDTLTNLKELCDYALAQAERQASEYYISIEDIGPDDNFVRWYTPLGFMTLAEAKAKVYGDAEDDYYDMWDGPGIKKVTREEYDMYHDIGRLTLIKNSIGALHENSALNPEFLSEVEDKIKELRSAVGFKYKWEVVNLNRF